MNALKTLACCTALLLLSACSATRLAYDHLDTVLRWQVSEYVDLTPPQRHSLDAELYPWWRWHRQSQLPLYAADLKTLAAEVQAGPLSLEQVSTASAHLTAHWNSLALEITPGYARLLSQLDDAQVTGLIRRIDKEMERGMRKRQKQSAPERLRHRIDETEDSLHDWIGRPNAAQHQLVQQWAVAMVAPEVQQAREQAARDRLERYSALLASRAQPGLQERLRDFMLAPAEAGAASNAEQQDQQRGLQFLADLCAAMDPPQREHLRQRLLVYAADFEALAAEAPSPGPTAPSS